MTNSLRNKLIACISGSALCIATVLIEHFEGVEYKPYYDVAGVLTVCYGHTGNDIVEGKNYTHQECVDLAQNDLAIVKHHVDPLIKVDLPEHTMGAIYSFVYNVGIGAFSRSTLLKKINAGHGKDACSELRRWIYAGGKAWNGLISRREVEDIVCSINNLSEL